jgi:hypothetical protein
MQKNKDSQRREPICKKREIKFGRARWLIPCINLREEVPLSLLQVHLIEKYCRCYEELVMNL